MGVDEGAGRRAHLAIVNGRGRNTDLGGWMALRGGGRGSWRRWVGRLWEEVGLLGDDDPGDQVGEDRRAAAEDHQHDEQDADQRYVPAKVLGEAGADSAEDASVVRAVDALLWGVGLRWRRVGRRRNGLAAVAAKPCSEVQLFATCRAVHLVLLLVRDVYYGDSGSSVPCPPQGYPPPPSS
jgi:hypothetical protein